GADSAPARLLRQPDGDQGRRHFLEAFGGVHAAGRRLDQEIRLARRVAGLHVCTDRRTIEEYQREPLSVDHRFVERNGYWRPHSASPGATAARSEEPGDFYRLPGTRHAWRDYQERVA